MVLFAHHEDLRSLPGTSLGICDGEMSQGSMRFDVNVSVKPSGSETLGIRTETKNLNSYKFMEEAIKREVERQIDVIEDGGTIAQETRQRQGLAEKKQKEIAIKIRKSK